MTTSPGPDPMASRQRPCARCIIGGVVGSLVVAWSLFLLVRLARTVTRGRGPG